MVVVSRRELFFILFSYFSAFVSTIQFYFCILHFFLFFSSSTMSIEYFVSFFRLQFLCVYSRFGHFLCLFCIRNKFSYIIIIIILCAFNVFLLIFSVNKEYYVHYVSIYSFSLLFRCEIQFYLFWIFGFYLNSSYNIFSPFFLCQLYLTKHVRCKRNYCK